MFNKLCFSLKIKKILLTIVMETGMCFLFAPFCRNFLLSTFVKLYHQFHQNCAHMTQSIYIHCLSGCLLGCLYPKNVKKAKRSGPDFVWNLTWPQRKFFFNPQTFLFVFVLQCAQRENVHNRNRSRLQSKFYNFTLL